jgi:hypothetical protein
LFIIGPIDTVLKGSPGKTQGVGRLGLIVVTVFESQLNELPLYGVKDLV